METNDSRLFQGDVNENGNGTISGAEEALDSFYFYEVEQFTVLWLLFVIIVAGNFGVLVTLYTTKSRKSRMNFFISHLAFADLTVGLVSVLTDIIWKMTTSWNAGNAACKIIKFSQVVVTYSSTYVLVALSIDRYDAIRHPMKFSGSWKRAKCLIAAAWILSAVFSSPILFIYEEKVVEGKVQCWLDFPEKWHWQLYMVLVSVSLFILPAMIITGCYVIIILTIWSKSPITVTKSHEIKDHLDLDSTKRMSSRGLIPRAKVKTVKITLVIVSVFILCWSPYIIFDLLQVFGHVPRTQTNLAIATFIQSLVALNSAANPIIYCIFSTHCCKFLCNIPPFNWLQCRKKKMTKQDYANQTTMTTTTTQSSSLSEILTNNMSSSGSYIGSSVNNRRICASVLGTSISRVHAVSVH